MLLFHYSAAMYVQKPSKLNHTSLTHKKDWLNRQTGIRAQKIASFKRKIMTQVHKLPVKLYYHFSLLSFCNGFYLLCHYY